MTLPSPILAGFMSKVRLVRPKGFEPMSVKEICSVSGCISETPDVDPLWRYNDLGFCDSEQTARDIITGDPNLYDMYAYEMFPFHCRDGEVKVIEVKLSLGQVPPGFDLVGYDIVTKANGSFFECSPLSCNGAGKWFKVNEYCLLDDEAYAYQVMLDMSAPDAHVEPGPYYLFKVYRKRPT